MEEDYGIDVEAARGAGNKYFEFLDEYEKKEEADRVVQQEQTDVKKQESVCSCCTTRSASSFFSYSSRNSKYLLPAPLAASTSIP
jgi:hypothetical protein